MAASGFFGAQRPRGGSIAAGEKSQKPPLQEGDRPSVRSAAERPRGAVWAGSREISGDTRAIHQSGAIHGTGTRPVLPTSPRHHAAYSQLVRRRPCPRINGQEDWVVHGPALRRGAIFLAKRCVEMHTSPCQSTTLLGLGNAICVPFHQQSGTHAAMNSAQRCRAGRWRGACPANKPPPLSRFSRSVGYGDTACVGADCRSYAPPFPKLHTGMPSFLALSARFSWMPVPGNTMMPIGNASSMASLRRNGAALACRVQSGR